MIEKITMVIADVDLTLSEKSEKPGPRTLAAIERLHDQGVLFGTASGRPFDHRSLDKAHDWGLSFDFDVAIGMNGGDVWDRFHEETEHVMQIKGELVGEILEFMWPLDCDCIIYKDAYDLVYAKRYDDKLEASVGRNHSHVEFVTPDQMAVDTGKLEIQYDESLHEEIMAVVNAHQDPRWLSVCTTPGCVEFMTPGLNKGVGLHRLAERNGIPISEIMAFGDWDNDTEMLREAGWGVCLLNGSEGCKAAADVITEYTCAEDGVGRWLEDHVFNR